MGTQDKLYVEFSRETEESLAYHISWAQGQAKKFKLNYKDPATLDYLIQWGLSLENQRLQELIDEKETHLGGGCCMSRPAGSVIKD